MITALAARWALTAVFAAAGLTAALPRRDPAGSAPAERASAVFCSAMCAALITMTWRSEPAAATRPQAALCGCAALWFGLTSLTGSGRGWAPRPPALFHTLMAGAMTWMLTTMPADTGRSVTGAARGAMTPMSRPPPPPRWSWSATCSRCLARPLASRGWRGPTGPGCRVQAQPQLARPP